MNCNLISANFGVYACPIWRWKCINPVSLMAQERVRMARRRRLGMPDTSHTNTTIATATSIHLPAANSQTALISAPDQGAFHNNTTNNHQMFHEAFHSSANSMNFPTTTSGIGSPVSTDILSEPSRSMRPFELGGENTPAAATIHHRHHSTEEYAVESLLPQPIFPVGSGSRASVKRRKLERRTSSLGGGDEDDLSQSSTVTQSTRYVRRRKS